MRTKCLTWCRGIQQRWMCRSLAVSNTRAPPPPCARAVRAIRTPLLLVSRRPWRRLAPACRTAACPEPCGLSPEAPPAQAQHTFLGQPLPPAHSHPVGHAATCFETGSWNGVWCGLGAIPVPSRRRARSLLVSSCTAHAPSAAREAFRTQLAACTWERRRHLRPPASPSSATAGQPASPCSQNGYVSSRGGVKTAGIRW
jgi:hypothetical protein